MTDTCEVSIMVVSYNTRELTLACLESAFAETRAVSFEIIVVDNASTDGSASDIVARFPKVKLLASNENLGFAGANNLASKDSSGRYIVLLNPDTIVLDGAIARLVRFAEKHRDYDIFSGRTLFADLTLNPTSVWRKPTLWNSFCRAAGLSGVVKNSRFVGSDNYGGWARDTVREVDIVSGCFLLIRRELWEKLGGFDTTYFMYGEDWDLCLRAKALGARCLFYPDAEIIHYGGASEPVRADKLVRLFQTKAKLYGSHFSPIKARTLTLMLRLWVWRCIISGELLGLFGYRESRKSAQVWRDVWKRRGEWSSEATLIEEAR